MYLVDTPGVLSPKLGDVETGMKLALCGEVEAEAGGDSPDVALSSGWASYLRLGQESAAHGPPGQCTLPGCPWVVRGQHEGRPGLGAGLGGAGA